MKGMEEVASYEMAELVVNTLDELIAGSAATQDFKESVRRLADGKPQSHILYNRESPMVKVQRLMMKLLEDFPEFPFEDITVQGRSGCSDYVGFAIAKPGSVHFEFEWDCHWRAEQQGWTDYFGDPDQIRASKELGYQCFRRLEKK